ncbi:MAG: hypothetical protein ACLUOF_00920 [Ruminococcus sp.]
MVSDDIGCKNIVAEIPVTPAETWSEVRTALQIADGKHPLYLFFQGSGERLSRNCILHNRREH